jgi:hypothetical protein
MKTRRERFESIAANRVQKVLDSIYTLEKCSNKNNYEYNEEDVNKMIGVIRFTVKELEESFKKNFNNKKNKFSF